MADEYGRVYSGMVAFVMRLSGGRIRDERTASYALLIFVVIIGVAALFLFFKAGPTSISEDWRPYLIR